jgi:putative ABC transport system ATP-binding protein
VSVLRGVDLSVGAGEIVIITGRSGAGKSTLLSLIGGLDRPTAGTVIVDGLPLDALPATVLARMRQERIGFVFQEFNLLPSWTALENVEAALLHTGMARDARLQRVRALLDALGLGDFGDHLPGELSVGQQQRVAVARALANGPAVILADEPSGGVDPETAQEIHSLLIRSVRESGAALVVATHGVLDVAAAARTFDLRDGVLTARAPAAQMGH